MSSGVGALAMVVNVLRIRMGAPWCGLYWRMRGILDSWCGNHYVRAYNGAGKTYHNSEIKQFISEFKYSFFVVDRS